MNSLSGKSAFADLRRNGVVGRSRLVSVVVTRQFSAQALMVGFAIPKTVGTAVVRNRCRRRLRPLVDSLAAAKGPIRAGSMLIRVHADLESTSQNALRIELEQAVTRAMAAL